MPSATLVGGVLGLGIQLYVNAVRKLPLWRNPWHHAIAIGSGAAFANWVLKIEAETEKELAGAWGSDGRGRPAGSGGHLRQPWPTCRPLVPAINGQHS